MGLRVLSIDGMLIRQTHSKILRCYGCGKYVLFPSYICGLVTHIHTLITTYLWF